MGLSKVNIKLIDTYLKNSDISFIDVRIELVDHISCAVEKRMLDNNQSFYYAFKDYMVENKRDLTKNYEKFRKHLQLKSFSMLWPELKKPHMLLILIASFFLLTYFEEIFSIAFPYAHFVWGLLLMTVIIYFLATLPKKKYRFSSLEMLSWPITFATYGVYILFAFGREKPLFFESLPSLANGFVALLICLNLSFLFTFFKMRKEYMKKFA